MPVRVLDSIHEDGAKLVGLTPDAALAVRAEQPGLKLVPVVYYRPAVAPRVSVESRAIAAAGPTAIRIRLKVVSRSDGTGVAGAQVVAFLDFANRVGTQGTTDAQGMVNLALGAARIKLDRMYVYPENGFWGALKRNVTIGTGARIALLPVDLTYTDAVRHFYGNSADNAECDHAARVEQKMDDWGASLFAQVFPEGSEARTYYQEAVREGLGRCELCISSDDSPFLNVPWELMRDPTPGRGHLAPVLGGMYRRRSGHKVESPARPAVGEPFRILLVIARPYGEQDLPLGTVARPMLEALRPLRPRQEKPDLGFYLIDTR